MPGASRVGLVIPVIDEAATIAGVVRAVPRDVIDEVIVVDGGSRDDTVAAARAAGARVIVEPCAGYGAACLVGVAAAADCAVIAFIDGDGSDDPADLRRIVGPIRADEQDFVIGSRAVAARAAGSMGAHQLLAGRLAGLAMHALYGVRYSDMGPLRAIRRDALEALNMRERTYGWNLEMQMRAAREGLRILELPVAHRHRAGGASKVAGSVRGTLRASWNLASTFLRVARS
jgi:glycosyltransferase involved in cell wall biosynthesis